MNSNDICIWLEGYLDGKLNLETIDVVKITEKLKKVNRQIRIHLPPLPIYSPVMPYEVYPYKVTC